MTITAKIVADSVSTAGVRLTTLQLRYPKFIHGEFMTHRVFSRNASSSRAIPVERLIKDVIDDPVYPSFWGKNQSGMQANEQCREPIDFAQPITGDKGKVIERFDIQTFDVPDAGWDAARNNAVELAMAFHNAGYHKQIVNRLLEPFCHINVVVTATEWSNFFALRMHKDAQPEMRLLATEMSKAIALSQPTETPVNMWHLPYVTQQEFLSTPPDVNGLASYWAHLIKLSVARCARVSYLTQEGREPDIDEDLKLYDRLVGAVPLHASPCEHQATPDHEIHPDTWLRPEYHGNFRGWVQYRKTLPGENQ